MAEAPCPICHGTAPPYDAVDFNKSCIEQAGKRLTPSGVMVQYHLCRECGFCFAPQFRAWTDDDFRTKIYNEKYAEVDPDYLEQRPAANARSLITLFGERKASIRHLDYGGGNGLLSAHLRKDRWRSESYDPFADGGQSLEQLGRFDLVTAFEVFEHVADVDELMKDLAALVKEDGIVFLSTLASDGSIAPGGKLDWWYAAPRNGHISLFSRKSLGQLADKSGFSCCSLSPLLHVFYRNIPSWIDARLAGRLRARAQPQLDADGFNALRMSRHGPIVYNKNDVYIGKALAKYGESCWIEHEFFRQFVRSGNVVVEAGANIGTHTLGLSRLVGPTGAVLAFEPQRIVFQNLCANLALNQCVNVHAFNEALGSEAGEVIVPSPDPRMTNNFGGISLLGATAGERIRVRTLDSFQLPACHFIKADVEGMELEVLRGAEQTIRKCRPVLYLENDRAEKSKELLEFIFSLDYVAYWHLPPLFNRKNFAGDAENIYPGIVSINVMCLPAEAKTTVKDMRQVLSPTDSWR